MLTLRACLVLGSALLLCNVLAAAKKSQSQESLQLVEALTTALKELTNAPFSARFSCPPPFTRIIGECFYFNHIHPMLTWDDARYVCQSAGGDLAEPEHFGALYLFLYTQRKGNDHRLRLGAKVDDTGTWKWVSGRPVEDVIWLDYEANTTDLCMSLVIRGDGPPALAMDDCQIAQYSVCELPL
ncbi:C-type lectin domain family 4 member M-like isoform X2 [Penaeus japonicus]|uniref:C-type lectin domain family 4 member M-like isoform X2 n=1 Tax=Penaeus japonicus TaxID=27405 RepID=UPI001C70B645|nr:C-type lectin domain family 4 member M-like isoform X2 [Penaeus japonicus]